MSRKQVKTMNERLREKLRFVTVGLINTGLDVGLFAFFTKVGVQAIAANYASTAVAMSVSYVLNRDFTFRAKGQAGRRRVVIFFAVTLFGLWVLQPLVIVAVSALLAHSNIDTYFASLGAKLVATGVSLVWNYVMYSRVVFRTTKSVE